MMKNTFLIAATLSLLSYNASANLIMPFESQFDTDFAYAGVGGLRGNGFGDISLSGVSGNVSQAYLYWHGPTNSSDPDFNANIMFDGSEISGTNIGFSDDNFWDQNNSQAYRADVTSLVAGDGTYALSGLQANHSNGASLVVYYDDGDDSNNTDVVTFDGNDANFANAFDPLGWDTTLSGINYNGGSASLLLGVSDGQSFSDGNLLLNGVNLNAAFNGTTVPQTAGSSVSNGGLWDLLEIDITSFLSLGLNDLNLTYSGGNDALSAIHFNVVLPAGSAPDQPDDPPVVGVPEPSTFMLMSLTMLGLVFRKRR